MAYEQRPGDISVFQETDKRNERAPDWKGSMIVPEGVAPGDKLEVAFWAKGGKGTMLAGSVKPPRGNAPADDFRGSRQSDMARGDRDGGRQDSRRESYDLNDDVPF